MQSRIIALLVPRSGPRATLLVRRRDGQFALQGIDARVASATQAAATWFRRGDTEPLVSYARLIQQEGVFHRDLAIALETT